MSREILFCPLCQYPFGVRKIPRLFPQCKHSFCQDCFLALLENQSSASTIKCPVDSLEMEIEDRSIHHFPKNFSLMKWLEKRNSGLSGVKSRTSLASEGDASGKGGSGNVLGESNREIRGKDVKGGGCGKVKEGEERKDTRGEEQQKKLGSMEVIVIEMIQKMEEAILDRVEEEEVGSKRPSELEGVAVSQHLELKQTDQNQQVVKETVEIKSKQKQPPSRKTSRLSKKDSVIETSKPVKGKDSPSQSSIQKQNICLAHDKPLDVVCIKDQKLICSACALFGDHKGHDIKSLNEIRKDIVDRERVILKLIEEKQSVSKQTATLFSDSAIMGLINEKREKVSKLIHDHIEKSIDKLREEEKKYLAALDKEAEDLFRVLKKQVVPLSSLLEQIKNCESRSLQILQILESDIGLEKKIAYLNYSKKGDFVDKISSCLGEIKEMKRTVSEKNVSVINKLNIKFKIPDFKNLIVFYKERTSLELAYEPILNQVHEKSKILEDGPQEELLIDLQKDRGFNSPSNSNSNHSKLGWSLVLNQSAFDASKTLSSLPMDHSMIRFAKSPTSKVIPKKVSSITPKYMPKSTSKTKLLTAHVTPRGIRSLSKVSHTSDGFSKTKLKAVKFKLPQKYQKLYNNLCMDSLEILDLTFAELGNQPVLYILSQLQNKKVKIIKLVRNKLSDDILKEMWVNMKSIQSLNLSQNSFSDKIIDSFMKNISTLESMRSLTLSQNKISSRTVKPQLDEIKRWNITISL